MNMSYNNILLDSITSPLDIILTSSSPKVIKPSENVSDNSVSSKGNKSHIAKIEDYLSKKYDEVALQHLKRELLKEINNEVQCKSAVNLNESLVVSLNIVIRNGKTVWKVVWIEYYLRLNLSFRRY